MFRSFARVGQALISVAAWLCLASQSMAQPAAAGDVLRLERHDSAATACLSLFELRSRVEQRTGPLSGPDRPNAGRVVVSLRPRRSGPGYRAQVRVEDAQGRRQGTRTLVSDAPDCRSLDEGLVLIVATLFGIVGPAPPKASPDTARAGHDTPAEAPSAQPSLAPAGEAEMAPAVPRPSGRPRPAAPRTPWQSQVVLGVGVATGLLPAPAPGFDLGVSASRSAFLLLADLLALPHARTGLGGGARASFSAALARLRTCAAAASFESWSLQMCAGARAGVLFVATDGLPENERRPAPAVGLELGVRAPLGRAARSWRGFVEVALDVPLYVGSFYREQGSERFTYHEVRPGLWAGVGATFGH